ncbi:MAG: hypothetical protein M1818_001301 [Claussenomyces sp. TS43310]|nr:MAG: hypothetical protein M1818_001301 [Claussenomyces sp. TS43310]
MITVITNARIFDGESLLAATTVTLDGPTILSIGGSIPEGAIVVDGQGSMLMPGLIDAHVHTGISQLRNALVFGVTTELEMMGYKSAEDRKMIAEMDDVADVRTASFGMTPPGGHPSQLHGPRGGKGAEQQKGSKNHGSSARGPPGQGPPDRGGPGHGNHSHGIEQRHVNNPEEATKFVAARVAEGADYIKVMIEEGTVLDAAGLPTLTGETILAGVNAAHKAGKLAIAHALTAAATQQAICAGMDGLAHIFLDHPHTPELVAAIAASGAFVTPCLVLNASIMGHAPTAFATDARVHSRLPPEWRATLASSFHTFPRGSFADCLATVAALHRAGVDLLVGSDASMPLPHLGGLAHGASVHHEMQLLVQAGLSPTAALRAATSVPATRFGLADRGRIAPGLRADLVLVAGDPLACIADSLNIRGVWRRGARLAS